MRFRPRAEVAPDFRARAPGRGAWIGVGRQALDSANARASSRPLAAGVQNDIQIPSNLGERIEHALARRPSTARASARG